MFEFINFWIGTPLGHVLRLLYYLLGSFSASLLVFAVIMRVVMFVFSYAAHKNSIRFLEMQPVLSQLKRRFSADKESLSGAQYELFRDKKYRPVMGLVPLFLQLLLLMGVLQVMYHPLQHVLGLSPTEIRYLLQDVPVGLGAQLIVAARYIDMNFLGLNLGQVPGIANPATLTVPFLSGFTALLFCLFQNRISPGALTQSRRANRNLTIFTVAFSVYFAWVTPAAVGVYWIVGNLLGILAALALEFFFSPKKLAPEAYSFVISAQKSKEEIKTEKEQQRKLKLREKEDAKSFSDAQKELVFYALSAGQYKYYKNTIEYILDNSDIIIHYLTNDPNDNVFEKKHPKLVPYYAGESKTVALLIKLDCKMFVTTVQDFHTYHLKRTMVRKDTEYIHIPHGPASLHLTAREAAYDHFDTFFCTGPHQADELRRREEMKNLPKKTLVKAGYGLLDQLIELYDKNETNEKPTILIAPSWQADNIFDLCLDDLLESLFARGWQIILRPHPQYLRVFPEDFEKIASRYKTKIDACELKLDTDFLDSRFIFSSDVLITDWSGIAFEFSFTTKRPSVFINTPMKVLNPNYEKYGLEPTDIFWRRKLGISIDIHEIRKTGQEIMGLLANKDGYKTQIEEVANEYIYYHGRSGEAGGKYIIARLRKD